MESNNHSSILLSGKNYPGRNISTVKIFSKINSAFNMASPAFRQCGLWIRMGTCGIQMLVTTSKPKLKNYWQNSPQKDKSGILAQPFTGANAGWGASWHCS